MAIIKDGSRNVELTGKDKEEYIKHRFPEHYYNKRKPLMTVGCEEIVTSREQELEMRIEWLLKGLNEISKYCNHNKEMRYVNSRVHNHFSEIEDKVKSILDGEPTTADRYNEE